MATPAAIFLLCLLSLAFFWKLVILRQVLIPVDLLASNDLAYHFYSDTIWQLPSGHPVTAPVNPLDADNITQFYPWAALAAQNLHRGILPLWNPFAFSGTPFLAAMQTAVLYPVNLVIEAFALPIDITGFRAIVHLAVALIGTFLFARRLAVSRSGALLAALAFGFSLPYVVWIEHPIGAAFAWLPWILLCIDEIIATNGRLCWLVITTAILTTEITAGHPESTTHVALLGAAFACLGIWRRWQQQGRIASITRPVIALFASLVLSCAISLIYLLPSLAQLPQTAEAADRSLASTVSALGEPRQWTTLVLAIVPNFFGNPGWHTSLLPVSNYSETALYVGLIPLLLALIAPLGRRNPYVVFFACASLVTLGIALRFPVLGAVNNLPLLRVANNGRLRIEYAFCIAVLAGFGADYLTLKLHAIRRLSVVILLISIALALLGTFLLHSYPVFFAWLKSQPKVFDILNRIYPGLESYLQTHHLTATLALPSALFVVISVLWLALFVVVLWLHKRGTLASIALPWIVLALTIGDLFMAGSGYHATASRTRAMTIPPAIRAIQSDRSLYRVTGLGATLLPSMSSLFNLQDIRGYDPMYDASYERFFVRAFSVEPSIMLRLPPTAPTLSETRVLSLMNVKYIFAPCHVRLNTHLYRLFYQGVGCIYLNTGFLPRALLVHHVQWSQPEQASHLLASGAINPHTTVLLDSTTPHRSAWAMTPMTGRGATDTTKVKYYGLNRVDITTQSSEPGVLVLSDAYAQGWKAYVDGHPMPIAQANGVFRAVAVGKGRHYVTFNYEPQTVQLGAIVSAIALLFWCGLLGASLFRYPALARHQFRFTGDEA